MAVGSVEPLPSGSYRAVVRAGVDPITRKRLKITETWSTEAEARAACERLSAQVEADTVPDRAATVEVLLRRWMGVADHELSTRETTDGYVRRTILPALGDMPLRKIQHRVDLLDRLYTHLRRCNELCDGRRLKDAHTCKPMSAGAIRRLHGILSAAFNYGISWGWMERNPAEHAHPPKLTRRRARPPEPEQIARMLNAAMAADLELGVFLWLAVTTGARRGELTGLRWSRVDEGRAELLFDVNYVVRSGQRQLKTTKSDEDRRIAMDPLSVDMLRGLRLARQEALKPNTVQLDGTL